MDDRANSLERPDDLGKTPRAIARRWKLEIKLADKREKKWREKARQAIGLYTSDEPALNSFNILWPNTETLRYAVYNSVPKPEALRRYKDADPIGRAVSEVLTRALEFSQDAYDFDGVLKGDTLEMLLAGRAVSRVRYVPDLVQSGGEGVEKDDDAQESEAFEEVSWEQVVCERVQWDDFRILCAAKTWEQVTAIGFRHRMDREELVEKFGDDVGNKIPLDEVDDDDVKKADDVGNLFKTAEVWEVWDKDEKQVVFICPTYDDPCKIQDDPLELDGFFPIPRPLYAIEKSSSLIPTTLYSQYEQQARELNRISTRINKLIEGLKNRGIYDACLTELSQLEKASDNELIPAQNVTALMERGGLEKAIWMMPIETAAAVLRELYAQRESTKQVIYEITGISDIMRSASDPNETFGAQKIKTQWGTQRLQKMQAEVQRYIRDLVRLQAEIIAEKFQPETLEQMSLVQLPHQAEVEQQYQQSVQQAVMERQHIPPMPQVVTWESVIGVMRNEIQRTYRVDIETDSTIAATQDADMQGLQQVLGGIAQIVSSFGPAVASGAIPIDVVKEIISVVVRRAKMGRAIEDVLDKLQAPAPAPDPHAARMAQDQQAQAHEAQLEQLKAQNAAQLEQVKAQANHASETARMQADQAIEQARAQATIQVEQAKLQAQWQVDEARRTHEAALKQLEHDSRAEMERYKADLDYRKAIEVAEISAKTTLQAAQMSAAQAAVASDVSEAEETPGDGSEVEESAPPPDPEARADDRHLQMLDAIRMLAQQMGRPKSVIRGLDGKIIGVQ